MTPGARIAAALEILDQWEAQTHSAEIVLKNYFRARRYAVGSDRRAITSRVYDLLRRRARLGWWCEREGMPLSNRARLIASMVLAEELAADDVASLFEDGAYAPSPLSPDEIDFAGRLLGQPMSHAAMAAPVAHEFPAWLEPEIGKRWERGLGPEMDALNQPAHLDLRVNTLKADCGRAIAALKADGIEAQPTALSLIGLRIDGRPNLERTTAYKAGFVEVQDEGSQLIALLCAAEPGHTVIDFCAGGGGKSLAIAAAQNDAGRVIACDTIAHRMAPISGRAKRAGARSVEIYPPTDKGPAPSSADRVLVDAPCSGTGVWRRHPDARWKLTPGALADYVSRQQEILAAAAALVKPGGRMIYATCSILPSENAMQIEGFLSKQTAFRTLPVAEIWADTMGTPCPARGNYLELSPAVHGTDGFFAAIVEHRDG